MNKMKKRPHITSLVIVSSLITVMAHAPNVHAQGTGSTVNPQDYSGGAAPQPYPGAAPQPYPGAAPPPYPGAAPPPYPGAAPPPYPGAAPPPYSGAAQPPYSSRLGNLLNDVKGLVNDLVQVDVPKDGSGKVHVKAPFVDVGVKDGHPSVNVNAPLVKVNKNGNAPASVDAPLTHIRAGDGVSVSAPLVNVQHPSSKSGSTKSGSTKSGSTKSGTNTKSSSTETNAPDRDDDD